ncbi:amino acid ABC transporter ATP-binding protein [Belnapia rosea]|uniref:Amino acid ABC transporter ATP-binding protein, PAAT family n=1 Tax=Belnapia rosea TaxID=938405 RepID=A0A1G6KEF8_9PROT|nr:amino acid ABC transporter ATP-binding protein [Belnapia rosea]SDC29343.1 amino acid ABC transporter ATP-binding protein, PAAT family [Belnapia rosea]
MPVVQVEGVRKSFGAVEVLKGIDLTVERGEVIAIIGRSGSGKSTLLRCINGLEGIQAGRIEVSGHKLDASGRGLRDLRKDVGIVFQSYNLFPHLRVGENIMLAPRVVLGVGKAEARQRAEEALAEVGLAERFEAWPDNLSGGQQQRVAIARSLAMKPKVMLFDEVTSALDPELTGEVLQTMERLAQHGMTMLLVTHEMAFARRVATQTIFMHQGKVWEVGPSERIFGAPQTPELRQFLGTGLK